jgi:hypothetical protein
LIEEMYDGGCQMPSKQRTGKKSTNGQPFPEMLRFILFLALLCFVSPPFDPN